MQELDGGVGVTMDDVLAGVFANISLFLILGDINLSVLICDDRSVHNFACQIYPCAHAGSVLWDNCSYPGDCRTIYQWTFQKNYTKPALVFPLSSVYCLMQCRIWGSLTGDLSGSRNWLRGQSSIMLVIWTAAIYLLLAWIAKKQKDI
jgi:hypothetical protein